MHYTAENNIKFVLTKVRRTNCDSKCLLHFIKSNSLIPRSALLELL